MYAVGLQGTPCVCCGDFHVCYAAVGTSNCVLWYCGGLHVCAVMLWKPPRVLWGPLRMCYGAVGASSVCWVISTCMLCFYGGLQLYTVGALHVCAVMLREPPSVCCGVSTCMFLLLWGASK